MVPLKKDLIIKELGESVFARNLIVLENLDSTNNFAIKIAENGAPEGTVVIAEEQSAGRGRMGRNWISPKYANLLMSVLLRPQVEVQGVFIFTMVMALSVTEAVYETFGLRSGIKWPNDIYLKGKKLGGILTEISYKGHIVEYAVVGLGLNINWKPEGVMNTRYPAVCIRDEVGGEVPRDKIIGSILAKLDLYRKMVLSGKLKELFGLWDERSITRGKMVEIDTGKEIISGRVTGIDRFGSLIMNDKEGNEKKFLFGEVSLKEIKNEGLDNGKNS